MWNKCNRKVGDIFIAMRFVGVYTFLLHLGTVPFYRSNIFRYCGHDVLSKRHCIMNTKKERAEARQRKIAAVYRVHWVITRFFRDILDGSSCDTRLIHSSSSNSKMQYRMWNILLRDIQFSRVPRCWPHGCQINNCTQQNSTLKYSECNCAKSPKILKSKY